MSVRALFALIDGALGVAERIVQWSDDRKARKRQLEDQRARGLSHQAVSEQQRQIRSATRPRLPPR